MHLGQTATNLALIFNRPEPSTKMVSRLLREGDYTQKGARGRNAPHLSSRELSDFLTALMCSPDSPATGVERLAHFREMRELDSQESNRTFGVGFARLLERLAASTLQDAVSERWQVTIDVSSSAASIQGRPIERPVDESHFEEEYLFAALFSSDGDEPVEQVFPYLSGLEQITRIGWRDLYRVSKVVLGNEDDPLDDIVSFFSEQSRGEG